ncbi:hypothetical protein GWO43_29135 [candidate division KSB1 bacterium]|nr:hypothetical protein [candidate division KSB1 bacterium]NIR71588.1 hypothetical protein [candidate division KSB1 bacterium]NIS27970.1 hypothetical protein [candidate division KSB1 bacterium]NIT74852.1 hypothetical protein [candidate division KSB1 bacterium]NIU28627.1 hypothetical protein [candidate division KSB1 bacterium]
MGRNKVIIDIKSVEQVLPVHEKQVLTDLQQTGNRLGLVLMYLFERRAAPELFLGWKNDFFSA